MEEWPTSSEKYQKQVPVTQMSINEYRDVPYVQYQDVQVPRCPDYLPMLLKKYSDFGGGKKNNLFQSFVI
jgi:hypothetical protein